MTIKMNRLFAFLILSTALTLVTADRREDIKCLNDKKQALEGMSEQQLFNVTQVNLNISSGQVAKRVKSASDAGFSCYRRFYERYVPGLSAILQTGLRQRLNRAKTPKERKDATKIVAGITQSVRCDEDWRAKNVNQTIRSANCTAQQTFRSLDSRQFKPKLALLQTGMITSKFALRFRNNVVSGIVGEMESLYRQIYLDGEKCANNLPTGQRCRNLKMFVNELNRLFYLFEIQTLARLSN